ncbi:hypothetical protein HC028_16900 [Planosporangium flavigriseum]|uniref:Peptidase C45 hydrolase domain-containing protein n=1 Tax=Planosporangium flavigriseum TaxID=373681 RepID=A0A8J3PMQ6_9ACTN|nr:C45 family autoproteolytic acyltransferase/hydolase [Planosporangium flavigriseum]NJC66171.1 hypothetical protein [Planosporangium flavigriseum]GIG75137.1 hypothetical protein Pfl04_35410 [Planosporangium flavigriseum]
MCTLVGRHTGAQWVLASNSDNPYDVTNHVISCVATPYSYLAVEVRCPGDEVVAWDGMVTRGVNSAGLAFTYAYVPEQSDVPIVKDASLPPQTWTRDMLATAATVDEALRFMAERAGQLLTGNYLIGDRDGEPVIAEVSGGRLTLTKSRDGAIACTNVWQTSPDAVPENWPAESASLERSERSWTMLGAGSGAALAEVLGDHDRAEVDDAGRAKSICSHGTQMGTISSELLDTRSRTLWWCYGWPCGQARGNENVQRSSWGTYVPFRVDRIEADAELVTVDGLITPAGTRVVATAPLPA